LHLSAGIAAGSFADHREETPMNGFLASRMLCLSPPTTFRSEDSMVRSIDVPTLVMHGDDDQIVPIADSALLSIKLLKRGTLKVYKGLGHGLRTLSHDVVNTDLLSFIQS